MNNQTIVCCVVALLLGMLLANMLKNVCGCKLVEGAFVQVGTDSQGRDMGSYDAAAVITDSQLLTPATSDAFTALAPSCNNIACYFAAIEAGQANARAPAAAAAALPAAPLLPAVTGGVPGGPA